MPAPVASLPSPRSPSQDVTQESHVSARAKKPRLIKRRRHARDGIDSDEEIERVLTSGSESDTDEFSSLDSVTDSDQESMSDGELPNEHLESETPNTSQSSRVSHKVSIVNGEVENAFFAPSGSWSEMVAEENFQDAAELPVIEFADFKPDVVPSPRPRTKKAKKATKKKANVKVVAKAVSLPAPAIEMSPSKSVDNNAEEKGSHEVDGIISESNQHHPKRPFGQSARQAYQQRLESDPSFVPRVGGFWGHDDRLLDKDLRSLSGWWRGRWQGRGRGRGSFSSGSRRFGPQVANGDSPGNQDVELPPTERPWTHDGYEELKRKEEQRLESQTRRQTTSISRSGRGRGSVISNRGRGGSRGGFTSMANRAAAIKQGRTWYSMKPELMWTKQNENFLFFDSYAKYRLQGTTYRVQLPGSHSYEIKSPVPQGRYSISAQVKESSASILGSDCGERALVVRLPQKCAEEEPPTTVGDISIEDVFTVRPRLVPVEPIPLPIPSNAKSSPPADKATYQSQSSAVANSSPTARCQREQLSIEATESDPPHPTQTGQLHKLTGEVPNGQGSVDAPEPHSHSRRPSLPPIQTVYTSPTQPPSAYASSYGYPTLPPGIALNQHGMPYELATGHPVYIPAPHAPMYNPRPLMHSHIPQQSMSFMTPPHMHQPPALSPDFMTPQHQSSSHSNTPVTLPVNGFINHSTGTAIFSLPRPSRVEIRAPDGTSYNVSNASGNAAKLSPDSSHLHRSSASYTESSSQIPSATGYRYPSSSSSDANTQSYPEAVPIENNTSQPQQHPSAAPMVPYPYQQYYYPEAVYGYPSYMDMSQVYDMYPPMEGHGTTYY